VVTPDARRSSCKFLATDDADDPAGWRELFERAAFLVADRGLGDVEALADRDEVLEHLGDDGLLDREAEQSPRGLRRRDDRRRAA
jgi:hypothetical protein